MSILMANMKVTNIFQKHFLCTFWEFLVTIVCDIKIDVNMCEPPAQTCGTSTSGQSPFSSQPNQNKQQSTEHRAQSTEHRENIHPLRPLIKIPKSQVSAQHKISPTIRSINSLKSECNTTVKSP